MSKEQIMDSNKLVIIGANEFQKPLVIKAKEMGYETHVFAWEDGAVCKEFADCFYPISIIDKDRILDVVRTTKPKGVISIASDLAIITVNYLATQLDLVGNNVRSTLISTNKYEMRQALSKKGLPCPKFFLAANDLSSDIKITFPLIVKPVDRSGSRGVTRVESYDELNKAIKRSMQLSFVNQAIVEEFVDGQEYSMEMLSFEGKHYFLAITEKFTTGSPNFVEVMHLQPGRIKEEVLKKAVQTIEVALDALEIEYGASHSEFKVNQEGDITIIEIGARMGGDYIGSDLVPLTTGLDFIRMVIAVATGINLKPQFIRKHSNRAALVRFIFDQEDVNLLEDLKINNPGKLYRYQAPDSVAQNLVQESSDRFGYFILNCDNVDECLNLVGVK